MPTIVTITLNPAIDKSAVIDRMEPEHKLRCTDVRYEPGGGGINVARALKRLGAEATAAFAAGGPAGQHLQELLAHEGVRPLPIGIQGWTRENFIVVESSTNHQFRFGMPGPDLTDGEAEQFLRVLEELKPDVVVGSGSLPPGVGADFYAQLARKAKALGAKCVLDTSGEALRLAVEEGAFLLKPNLGELSKLVGVESIQAEEVETYARQVLAKGATEALAVSMGPAGAVLVTKDELFYVPAPPVRKRSTVGAGDCMVAGMVYCLAHGKSLREMVQFGVACGTAATMNQGTELFKVPDVQKLHGWICRGASQAEAIIR